MSDPTARALTLLALLQSRPVWTGPELAERLGVTTRSVRRDVDRLRDLGYPVHAAHGIGGGYQLGSGRGMPPLLLDDEEAVAVAVSLRMAAGGTVAGASEAALRALTKLDQVLPARLRGEISAILGATDTLGALDESVDGEALLTLARACRDQVRVRFGYVDRSGSTAERRVEPVRLVAAGRRWYLMAHDLDRDDWRTFRLDRMDTVRATTWRFTPRPHPDPVEFVGRAVTSPYPVMASVRLHCSLERARELVPPTVGTVTAISPRRTRLEVGAGSEWLLAVHLAMLPVDFTLEGPASLRATLEEAGRRLLAAAL